jgi:hypothetical protein
LKISAAPKIILKPISFPYPVIGITIYGNKFSFSSVFDVTESFNFPVCVSNIEEVRQLEGQPQKRVKIMAIAIVEHSTPKNCYSMLIPLSYAIKAKFNLPNLSGRKMRPPSGLFPKFSIFVRKKSGLGCADFKNLSGTPSGLPTYYQGSCNK